MNLLNHLTSESLDVLREQSKDSSSLQIDVCKKSKCCKKYKKKGNNCKKCPKL